MARGKGRLTPCTLADARERLSRGEAFLAAAELVLGETVKPDDDEINLTGVSAALAVLAGIAAADAACCAAFGERSRGQDHRAAVDLVKGVAVHGDQLSKDLDRLLDLKDNAHYGVLSVKDSDATKALTWAGRMVKLAREVVRT